MLFLNVSTIIFIGLVLYALIIVQLLLGLRTIKLPGRRHWKVHRYNGYLIVAIGLVHGGLALWLFGPGVLGL